MNWRQLFAYAFLAVASILCACGGALIYAIARGDAVPGMTGPAVGLMILGTLAMPSPRY